MAVEDIDVGVSHEHEESFRGQDITRTTFKQGKSKARASPTDSMEKRIVVLEHALAAQEGVVGELSEQIDNVMQENKEITRATKGIIVELVRSLEGIIHSLA